MSAIFLIVASLDISANQPEFNETLCDSIGCTNGLRVGGWIGFTTINKLNSKSEFNDTPEFGAFADYTFTNNLSGNVLVHYDPTTEKGRVGQLFLDYHHALGTSGYYTGMRAGILRTGIGVWADSQLDPSTKPNIFLGNGVYPANVTSDVATDNGFEFYFGKDTWQVVYKYVSNSPDDPEEYAEKSIFQKTETNTDLGSLQSLMLKLTPTTGWDLVFNITYDELTKDPDVGGDVYQYWFSTKYERSKWLLTFDFLQTDAEIDVTIPQIGYRKTHNDVTFYGVYAYAGYSWSEKLRLYASYNLFRGTDGYNDYIVDAGRKMFIDDLYAGNNPQPNPALAGFKDETAQTDDIALGFTYYITPNTLFRGEYHYLKASGYQRIQEDGIRPENSHYYGFSLIRRF
jgi:hypothetical protein